MQLSSIYRDLLHLLDEEEPEALRRARLLSCLSICAEEIAPLCPLRRSVCFSWPLPPAKEGQAAALYLLPQDFIQLIALYRKLPDGGLLPETRWRAIPGGGLRPEAAGDYQLDYEASAQGFGPDTPLDFSLELPNAARAALLYGAAALYQLTEGDHEGLYGKFYAQYQGQLAAIDRRRAATAQVSGGVLL